MNSRFNRFIGIAIVLLLSYHSIFAQKVTENRIKEIIIDLKIEAKDSIKMFTILSDSIRKEMLVIVKEKEFKEIFIWGPDRKYFNEGMSSQFIKVPKVMFPKYGDRDKKVVLLEKNHVKLFHLDLKLNISKNILKKLDSINIKNYFEDILNKPDSFSTFFLKKYIAYHIVDMATKNIKFSKITKNNTDHDVSIEYLCEDNYDIEYNKKSYIKSSYPYDGQYNLHVDKERKDIDFGFLQISGDIDSRLFLQDSVLVMIFTNSKGSFKVIKAQFNSFQRIITFAFPYDFLKRGELFKLQLALQPKIKGSYYKNTSIEELTSYNYYNLFKIIKFKRPSLPLEDIATLYNPIYFRTSIFPDKITKLKNSKIVVTKNPFIINLKLEEPFDDFEINGTKCYKPIISLVPSSSYLTYWWKMKDKYLHRTAYYLKVPIIEEIDTNNTSKNYTALLDNTIDNDNILKANKEFANNYINNIESIFDIDYSDYVNSEIKQNKSISKINEKDFKKGKVKKIKKATLLITIPRYIKLNDKYSALVKKMKIRKIDRANYFYKLHIVESKRKKIKPTFDLLYYLEREEKIVKSIIGSNYEIFSPYSLLNKTEKLRFKSIIPHTDLSDFNIPLSIDYSKYQ